MKEFIWKVCCLIWHFDERVIREYKEKQFQDLKRIEESYWECYQKRQQKLDSLESYHINIDEDNFLPYHYGNVLTDACNYQTFWNNIYDRLFNLGNELGKTEELKELRKKRN